jgi:hypothetical protein
MLLAVSSYRCTTIYLFSKPLLERKHGQNPGLKVLFPLLDPCSLVARRVHLFPGRDAIVKAEFVFLHRMYQLGYLLASNMSLVPFLHFIR